MLQSYPNVSMLALKVFGIGHGWGGFESLIVPATHPSNYRTFGAFKSGTLVRINVGLENLEDLKNDLEQAFKLLVKG